MAFTILLLLLTATPFCLCQLKNIVFTQVIYRHGDRSPTRTFPNDPYQEEYWPQGWSQLTNKGMKQQYELGKYLKRRYIGLLSESYKREEIYVRSTDKDRTLQSAQCNLAGMYPANGSQKWTDEISLSAFQPIPIHTVPEDDDILLNMAAECPNYAKLYVKDTEQKIKAYNEAYKDFFKYVGEKTGLNNTVNIETIGDNVYGPLFREREQDLPLPQWVDEVFNKTNGTTVFDIIVQLKIVSTDMAFDSEEKAKYRAGFLLGEIIENMKIKANKSVKKAKASKMIMYSAHDDSVLALMFAMNLVSEALIVPYVGCLMIELYKNESEEFSVQVSFRNNTTTDKPLLLQVPGCSENDCSLENFEQALSYHILYPAEIRNNYCGIPKCKLDVERQSDDKNGANPSIIIQSKLYTIIVFCLTLLVFYYIFSLA